MATLGKVTANGIDVEFKKLNVDVSHRYFIDLVPSGPQYDIGRFHAPGWNGNALIRKGFTGQQIAFIVRYQGTLTEANYYWKQDRDLFSYYNCTLNKAIIGETAWTRCTMLSSDRTSEEMAYGSGGTKFFTVRYLFTAEEQY